MSADHDGGKTDATGPGTGRPPAETPARIQIRHEASTPGESAVISAADTAMALARDVGSSQAGIAATEAGDGSGSGGVSKSGRIRSSFDDEPPQLSELVGTTLLGRYQITRKIGQGGMGAVFEATHLLIGKRVAVKVLLDKYARREAIVARLEQEARLASSMRHEHIIDINDFGTTEDGRTFVVMEFLEGESLAECLHREGQLPEQRILRMASQIASALGAAHAKGIVHRDVKPENIFITQRAERDFVVDFGISKSLRASDAEREEAQVRLTQTGMVLGTPLYMSPEQARGDENLDAKIDIYALGVIMYELATGRVPFMGTNYLSVISQVLNDEAKAPRSLRPDLSEEFDAIVMRALEKDKESRYPSTEAMNADITALLDDPTHSTERARISGPRRRSAKKRGGRALLFIGGAIGVAAAAVIAVVVMMRDPRSAAGNNAIGADASGVAATGTPDAAPGTPDAKTSTAETITFQIVSTPKGAMVYEGSRELGPTPYNYTTLLNDDKIELVAHLDGYNDAPFSIIPTIDKTRAKAGVITVPMTKPKKGQAPIIKIKKAGQGVGTGTGADNGGGSGTLPSELGHNPYPK